MMRFFHSDFFMIILLSSLTVQVFENVLQLRCWSLVVVSSKSGLAPFFERAVTVQCVEHSRVNLKTVQACNSHVDLLLVPNPIMAYMYMQQCAAHVSYSVPSATHHCSAICRAEYTSSSPKYWTVNHLPTSFSFIRHIGYLSIIIISSWPDYTLTCI